MKHLAIGSALVTAGLAVLGAGVARAGGDTALERLRWQDRVFLVVADGGPTRVPFKELMRDPHGFFWKRRVGCAVYVGEGRFFLTTRSVVGDNAIAEIFHDDGDHVLARVVGADPHLDVALLETMDRVPRTDGLGPLPVAPEGSPGQACMVLGSAYGRALSACRGTLGELALLMATSVPVHVRRVEAPIYPGDSGGPVLDPEGRFLGLVTAVAGPEGEDEAVLEESGELHIRHLASRPASRSGFVLPAADCLRAWQELREHGRVRRGFLGLQLSVNQVDMGSGVEVLTVLPRGPAAASGVRAGDRILEFGGTAVTDPRQLCALVASALPGETVDLRYTRGDEDRFASVQLGEAKSPPGLRRLPVPPSLARPPGDPAVPVSLVDSARAPD